MPADDAVLHEPDKTILANDQSSGHTLKLLSFNIQVAMASTRARHYLTQSWKHVLPHSQCFDNLGRIAQLLGNYDIVGLQEVDGGSLRSYFVNQVEYLAERSRFPFWHQQTNRNLGNIAKHSNGLLSKFEPSEVVEYKLPGALPGRGALLSRYGHNNNPLVLIMVHLALGKRARQQQLDFISELVSDYQHVCLMGDFNCTVHCEEMEALFKKTDLCLPEERHLTFPSWRPARNIDHILASPSINVQGMKVVNESLSDHLPIAMEIKLPPDMRLV